MKLHPGPAAVEVHRGPAAVEVHRGPAAVEVHRGPAAVNVRLDLAAPPSLFTAAEALACHDALRSAVRCLAAPLRVWHGPIPAAAGRPHGTWLSGRVLPELARAGGLLRWIPDELGAYLPACTSETAAGLALSGSAVGRLLRLSSWPASLRLDWLAGLSSQPALAAAVLFLEPIPSELANRLARRRLTQLTAERMLADRAGRLPGGALAGALRAVSALRARLAAGETALVRARLYVALTAASPSALDAAARQVNAALAAAAPGARLTGLPFEQLTGWRGLLGGAAAAGRPGFAGRWRVLDAEAAALCIPLPVPALRTSGADPLVGTDPRTRAQIRLDRFALANPGRLVVGSSGAGKSYAAKLEVHRWLRRGGSALVVDPEGEFLALADAVGGSVVTGAPDPLALLGSGWLSDDAALNLLAATVAACLGEALSTTDLALLQASLGQLRAGRAGDLGRLGELLRQAASRPPFTGSDLPLRLAPLSAGSFARHLQAQWPDNPAPLVVADLRASPEPLRPAVTAGLLGWAWVRAASALAEGSSEPQLMVVDEAHLVLADQHAAALLAGFARRARKYRVAFEVITQRLSDFLDCPQGRAVLDSAASRLLFAVAEPERSEVARVLGLSAGEAAFLSPGAPGAALLCCQLGRIPLQISADPDELSVVCP
ncbi:MAG: VirB4 family type IV secretion system protein [Mycobacteriales bacterium]